MSAAFHFDEYLLCIGTAPHLHTYWNCTFYSTHSCVFWTFCSSLSCSLMHRDILT